MDIQDINVGDMVRLTAAAASLYPLSAGRDLVVAAVSRHLDEIHLQIEPIGTSSPTIIYMKSRHLLPAVHTIKYGPPPPLTPILQQPQAQSSFPSAKAPFILTPTPILQQPQAQSSFPSAKAPSILTPTPIPTVQPKFKVGDAVQLIDKKNYPRFAGPMIVTKIYNVTTPPMAAPYWYDCTYTTANVVLVREDDLELSPNGILSGAALLLAQSVDIENSKFITKPDEIKCECGSESVGYTTHSSWCGKFSK